MIKEGSKVRHKRTLCTAYVLALCDDIEGGVLLDRYIDGFRYWNVEDLTEL